MKRLYIFLLFIGLCAFALANDSIPDKTNISPEYPYLPSEVKSLVDRTFSINATVRGEAAYRLGMLGVKAEKASPFLIRMLDDNSPVFCRYNGYGVWTTPGKEAAKSLAKIGKPTFKYIIPVLENKHPYISVKPDMERNIVLFLTEISGQNFGNDLFKWINWIKSQEI